MRIDKKQASTAYHEAGHAVVAFHLRVKVTGATITPTDEAAGRMSHSNPLSGINLEFDASDRTRLRVEKLIQVCLAGPIAQRRHNPRGFRRSHAAGDWESVSLLLDYIAGPEDGPRMWYENLLNHWTAGLVNRNWYVIESLAAALLSRKTLNGPECRRVIFDAFEKEIKNAISRRRSRCAAP